MKKIETLYVFVEVVQGEEYIAAVSNGKETITLITFEEEHLPLFKSLSRMLATNNKTQINLLKFTNREELEVIMPKIGEKK